MEPARRRPRRPVAGGRRRRGERLLRPHRPARSAAVRRGRAGPRGRTHRPRGHRHRPRGRGAGGRPRQPARPAPGGALPELGDPPARAAQPSRRHRRPPARGAAPAGAPVVGRPCHRTDRRGRRSRPQPAAAAGQGARRPRAGAPRPRPERTSRRRHPPAGRHLLRPRRAGREARRVRRTRWDPRCLPAHRGAPDPGGVLGRRRRGGALVQGGRPALAGAWSSTGCGRRRAASCC